MITDKSIVELSELLDKQEISSVETAKAFLERIDSLNTQLKAYITVNEEQVLKEAAASDERRSRGETLSPWDGVPVAVKDNIATEGILTTCGSRILHNFVPPYDATSYEKMKALGFILLGKTNMDEFAMGSTTETSYFGITKNPFDRDRVPGGSSGGSAAAVAARMAPAALGSDTGGSIRQPASFCGVVGIKPTYGRVSRYGLVAFASSLDQIGALANRVDDAAVLLGAVSGHDPRDTTSVDREVDFMPESLDSSVKGSVIGVPREYFNGVDAEVKAAIEGKLKELEGLGANIEEISLGHTEYAIPIYYLIATAEASSNLARYDGIRYGYRTGDAANLSGLYFKSRSEGFGKEVKRRIILGTFSLSSGYYDAYYLKALKGRTQVIEEFREAFSRVDAIMSPVTTGTASGIGELMDDPLKMYMSDILTISVNLAGIPGISVPVGLDNKGLPIGLQIMGDHFQEKKVLSLARAVEETCDPLEPDL